MSTSTDAQQMEWNTPRGAQLKQARLAKDLTQDALAKLVGTLQHNISLWENAKGTPSEEQLKMLTEQLGPFIDEDDMEDAPHRTELGLWLKHQIETKKEAGENLQTIAAACGLSVPTLYSLMNSENVARQKGTLDKLQRYFGLIPKEVQEEATAARALGALGEYSLFNPHNEEEWPPGPGVYVLYDTYRRPTYIGKSRKSISGRLKDHSTRFWFRRPLVEEGAFVFANDEKLIGDIEDLLIKVMGSLAVINDRGTLRDECVPGEAD